MKVNVDLLLVRVGKSTLSKEVQLAAVPYPGTCVSIGEDEFAVVPFQERGIHLYISENELLLSGYGPQYDEETIAELVKDGWDLR